MRIIIFGASGATGKLVVKQALEKGYLVRAFVRNPQKLGIIHKNLSTSEGNITNPHQVLHALTHGDVVVSTLGNKTSRSLFRKNNTISEGTQNIVKAMKLNNISRLLFLTSFGINSKIFLPEKLFIRIVLKNIFADLPTQEKIIKDSTLAWTIIRPARLVDSQQNENYQIGEDLAISPLSKISRTNVADFILREITQNKYIQKTVTIKNL